MNKILFWLPRGLSVLFVIFLSLFALDVFGEYSGWGIFIPLLMHLLPSLFLLGVIIVAWKHNLVGTVFFIGFAVSYIWAVGLGRPWSWYIFISGPAFITGILFFINWFIKNNKKSVI